MSQSPSHVMPDIEALVTEDDTPVDNMPSEKQQRLLTEPLFSSWAGPGAGRTFVAAANVGVFPEPSNPAIVPDVFLSLDVQVHANWWDREHRSYFVWEFGKPPDLVVEIVSNQKGNEIGGKRQRYAEMGVGSYVIHDPLRQVMDEELRVYRLRGGRYERQASSRFPDAAVGADALGWCFRGCVEQVVALDGRARRDAPDGQGARRARAPACRARASSRRAG